jgi:hypothetical protein
MPQNQGLLRGVDARTGYPATAGAAMDPLIVEARRFYDVTRYPRAVEQLVDYPEPFTGAAPGLRLTAPLTFEAWKAAFSFSDRQRGEPLEQYRQRAGLVTYYNRNELGLGRELGCADFVDAFGPNGEALLGLACFVTNYGSVFSDPVHSLEEAIAGAEPRNTVAITWRPSMEPGYEVQFYVYGADGRRTDWAQLDNYGPRPHPHICMSCHGGAYDEGKHLAKNARFLPLEPNLVVFAPEGGDTPPSLTREGQEERIRIINAATLRTPLSPAQEEMIHELYGGQVAVPGARSRPSWLPAGWRGDPRAEALFDQVIRPYCGTCHMAAQKSLDSSVLFSYGLFRSPADLRRFPLGSLVCGSFGMPNASPTLTNFWDQARGPVVVGGREFPAGADAFLDWLGLDRSTCTGFDQMSTCNRGPSPDEICGNAASGWACNRLSGRCVRGPDPDRSPPSLAAARGLCRTDGTRACPPTLECTASGLKEPGIETFDGVCMPKRKR